MLNWISKLLQESGLGRFDYRSFICIALLIASLTGWSTYQILPIPAFAFGIAVGTLGLISEVLQSRAKSRIRTIARCWPEVLDSLISGASSGVHPSQTFAELAESGPVLLRRNFVTFQKNLDFGASYRGAIQILKAELGNVHSDRLVELLLIVDAAGGLGFIESLKAQAEVARQDLALWGEIEAKQGWVTGTAKIAIAAPWIIIVLLSMQPGNLQVYSSEAGTSILIVGLSVSIFAYRLIRLLGGFDSPPRVFNQ